MTGELGKYKVVMNGTTLPNFDREEVIRELCELFHSRPSTMEKLLGGEEVPLKKEYPRDKAEKICRAIRQAGAQCKMVPVQEQELAIVEDDYSYLSGLSMTEYGHAIICPGCERECDSEWDSCQYCGYKFVRREQDSGFSFGTTDADEPPPETQAVNESQPRESMRMQVIRFIGPNADDYAQKFSSFGTIRNPKFQLSWHWPAFFFFFFWALYRKMWLWAGLNVLGAVFLVFLTPLTIVWLIYSLFWPLVANYLYFRHIAHHMRVARARYSGEEREEYLAKKGGVSKNAVWIGLAASFAFSAFSSNMTVSHLMSRYEEQFGDSIGSAPHLEQIRGDGSIMEAIVDEKSELAQTSRMLNTMATKLKLVIAAGNDELINQSIDGLVASSENEEILDAWGNPFVVNRESNRVVFVSPGPDGAVKTDDDVLQMVNY